MDELQETRRRIRELMQYAVPEKHMAQAQDLLVIFREDRLSLTVLDEFYRCLPEGQDDWVKELRLVARKAGIFLLAAVTSLDAYLYLISSEGIEFHGSMQEGYLDKDLLCFFEFSSSEQFCQQAQHLEDLPFYEPIQTDFATCPSCHAATGEEHELGCPVEVCPWCGGQLIHCECRFAQLDLEELATEQDLIRFEELLQQKGRLVYTPEQRPTFADEGPGIEIQ
ncbi:MAG: hypothetical protein WGN25_13070 [Candidatus Electrothrix sp. GW3-4]|uniref:hypothetical protein n=1 Tax=Candidatus Electrothrix sp. GW3-4 TaxID=3126740 RepID=UPI0030CA6FBA